MMCRTGRSRAGAFPWSLVLWPFVGLACAAPPPADDRLAELAAPGPVRGPVVAGRFYAAEPDRLRAEVERYLGGAKKVSGRGELLAVISPHAGYVFSGPVAGWAFKQLEGEKFEAAVVIGGHASRPHAAVFASGAYRTPLGDVPVDEEFAAALLRGGKPFKEDPRLHESGDHALEVQLPFLQVASPRTRIVPVYFNMADPELAARVGRGIAGVIRSSQKRTVIVCSTDLSHYPDAETAEQADKEILAAICTLDPRKILDTDRELLAEYRAKNLDCTACGLGAVLATVEAAKELGATDARVLRYEHSGNRVRKDRSRVVGYGAVAFYGKGAGAEVSMTGEERMLSDEERKTLLALARRSVELALDRAPLPKPEELTPALERPAAVFVTLRKRGGLRGCIGTFERTDPLWKVVAEFARSSAFRDSRFPPVKREELEGLTFEISVLSPLRKLEDPLSIRLGVDGVWIVGSRGERGTFLPQVATETGWSKEEFLSSCCSHKAGLPAEAWRDPGRATVHAYTAEVFSEEEAPEGRR